MKKIIVSLLLVSFLSIGCASLIQQIKNVLSGNTPQINTNDIVNDVTNNVNNQLTNITNVEIDKTLKELLDKTKQEIAQSYNVTDFQYAISFGDNASTYENAENYKNIATYSYYLLDPQAPDYIQARNANTSGQLLYVTQSYQGAEYFLLKANEIYQRIGYLDSTEAILNMSNLGLLYMNMGKYATSEDFLKMALLHRQNNTKDTVGYAATLNNLAVLYKTNGNYSESEKYLQQASDFIKKNLGQNNIQYAIVLNNLAMLYLNINKLDQAEKDMIAALDFAKNNVKDKSTTYIRLKVNLALIYKAKKDYPQAEKILLDALSAMKTRLGNTSPEYATILRSLAALYMEMGNFNLVEQRLTEALKIYKDNFGEQNPQYANTLFELAVYNQYVGKIDIAQDQFTQALDVQKQTLSAHHPQIAKTTEFLAINYWHKNDVTNAYNSFKAALDEDMYIINNYFESMSDAEKAFFWNEYQHSFIRFYNFVAQNAGYNDQMARTAYNYHLQTKALLLNNSRKVRSSILESNNPQLIAKFTELNELKNYIAKLYAFSNQELIDRKINLDSLITASEKLEKDVIALSADYRNNMQQKNVLATDIISKLANDEVAIEIIQLNKYNYEKITDSIEYLFLILHNNSQIPEIVVMQNGRTMEKDYYAQYQKAIMNGQSMNLFYNYYWKDVDEKLSNVKKIYLSVDGIYNRLNINTFLLPDSSYIIDKFMVYNLTNTKDVITLKQRITTSQNLRNKTAVLIGFPNYSKDMPQGYSVIPPLPGTKIEIEDIAGIMKSYGWQFQQYEQDFATESKLKSVKNPYVLHIATHGYFIEANSQTGDQTRTFGVENQRAINNPLLRSGLLFAGADKTVLNINDKDNTEIDDGILNSYEAMTMQLDQTQLVVLSACQTGLGEIQTGEGVYGLQRAFQIAGAKTIITSLWPVSDEGTQLLMSNFYKNWLKTGDEFTAFREASLYIKDKLKYPFYWGAFEIVGK